MDRSEKKNNRLLIARFAAMALIFLFLAGTVTYSWIRRNWTPQISQENIMIETSNSLAFRMNADGTSTTSSGLAALLGIENIVLKPVSNYSGASEDFFSLVRTVPGEEFFTHLEKNNTTWDKVGIENGYVEVNIQILGKDSEGDTGSSGDSIQWVFLHEDSHLLNNDANPDSNGIKALRMSVSYIDNNGKSHHLLFVPDCCRERAGFQHEAITNEKVTSGDVTRWIADNTPYYKDDSGSRTSLIAGTDGDPVDLTVTTGGFFYLSDFDGGVTHNDDGEIVGDIDPNKCLFSMNPSNVTPVTVRLWLEGEDEFCTDEIAGDLLDVLVKFDSVCVTKDDGQSEAGE